MDSGLPELSEGVQALVGQYAQFDRSVELALAVAVATLAVAHSTWVRVGAVFVVLALLRIRWCFGSRAFAARFDKCAAQFYATRKEMRAVEAAVAHPSYQRSTEEDENAR